MLKKILMTAVVAVVGLFVVHKTGLDSYARTGWKKAKACAKGEVPLEFEIERIRQEVGQLVPDMKKHLSTMAQEMVTVERLQKEIADTRVSLNVQKDKILTMRKDLNSGTPVIAYDGRSFSASRVRDKLTKDFDAYKRCEGELKTREMLLDAREKSLDAARQQLADMKTQKTELEVRVAQLEAKLKMVRAAQTRNKFQFDDSQLARCKSTLAEIEDRMNVEERASELYAEFATDAIPVDKKEKSTVELNKEIDSYFGEPKMVAEKK